MPSQTQKEFADRDASAPNVYVPLIWPFGHLWRMAAIPENGPVPVPAQAVPVLSFKDHVTTCFASVRSFLVAWFCIYYVFPDGCPGHSSSSTCYPAFLPVALWSERDISDSGGVYDKDYAHFRQNIVSSRMFWQTLVFPLLVRNILGTWIICGFWDWILYFSPWKARLHRYKMNPKYPKISQMYHDACFSTLASVCGTIVEIAICYWYAIDTVSSATLTGTKDTNAKTHEDSWYC